MSRKRVISFASDGFARIPRPRWLLSLEEPVRRDGHRHLPRLRIDEIRQRKDHAIADPGDDADNRQETEQTGHNRVSGGKLTSKSGREPGSALPACSPFPCKSLWHGLGRG